MLSRDSYHSSDRSFCVLAKIGTKAQYRHEADQIQEHLNNAEFIAHARTDIPDLIAEVERLRIVEEAAKGSPSWIAGEDAQGFMDRYAKWADNLDAALEAGERK